MVKKSNKLFVIISTVLVFILFISLVSGEVFNKQISELRKATDVRKENVVEIDWEQRYPFDIKVKEVETTIADDTEPDNDIITRCIGIISKFKNIGGNWARLTYKYEEISHMGSQISSCLVGSSAKYNQSGYVMNGYVKLKNGYWVGSNTTKIQMSDAYKSVVPYASLKNYLNDNGIGFLYGYTPNKECAVDKEQPSGVISYANDNIDTYISALEQYGVECLDFRKSLHDDGMDHYSLFYKTDHHWNVDAGMWATSVLEDVISQKYNLQMDDVFSLGKYKRIVYENAMFGSQGHGVTHSVAESEDFEIMYPCFSNNFLLEIPDKGIYAEGSFEDIFVDYEGIDNYISQGGGYVYEQILYGNRPYERIINKDKPNAPKVLMIKDSFGIAVAPYLALSCSELVLLDTRDSNGNFNGSIISCIEEFNPDIVIALQSFPQTLTLNK